MTDPEFFKEDRTIKYYRLNEIAKLIEHKKVTDSIQKIHAEEISSKDDIINSKQNRIDLLESRISNLEESISDLQRVRENEGLISSMIQKDLKARIIKERRKRFSFGGFAGYGYGLNGQTPIVGGGISYALFKW